MKSKRLLTLLLVVCMVVTMLAPAASAVQAGEHAHDQAVNTAQDVNASALGSAGHTRKDGSWESPAEETSPDAYNGGWIATRNDNVDSVVLNAQTPAFLEELRAAAEVYSASDVVSAFVVLEEQPLAEAYSSIVAVPDAKTAQLQTQQTALIARIESDVLHGGKLEVEGQFTYLTNSVAISIEFGNLEAIASLPGVKTVFLTPVYEPCAPQEGYSPLTVSSGVMSGVPSVWNIDYTGKGMTVAILDTGIDMDHPSFKADPALGEDSWNMKTVAGKLSQLNAHEINPSLTSEALYYSAKLPYTFNYVTGTTDVNHDPYVGDHGSHVAGIVAANKVEGINVMGMAPDAQLVVMQVFDPNIGGANLVDILNALEDAMTLECDVVNMSLGTPAGFSTTNTEELNAIYARIAETDIIVDIAAGNEGTSSFGNLWGTNLNPTEHIDNATVSSPSTYANAMSVASVDNAYSVSPYFTLGEDVIAYSDAQGLYVLFSSLAGEPVEYVMVPGLGKETDYVDIDVEGKVAVVNRGEITFSKKLAYAEAAGAIGMIVVNNEPGSISSFGMSMLDDDDLLPVDVSGYVPAVLVTQTSGQKLAAAEKKAIVVAEEEQLIVDEYGGQPSSFSSWGVTPDLRLLPDLAGVGGNVYSCFDGGEYGFMSGTSMATPQVAGVTALVLQYLKEQFPEATEDEMRVLVDSLLMSTAVPVLDKLTGLEASPRHQGAGLVNALNAVTSGAYLTVAGSARPKAELGDNADGSYSFTFTVHNFSDTDKTYTLSSSLLTEDYTEIGGKDFMAEYEHALDNDAVSFSAESVTVAAGSSADVTVTISLTDADKAWINEHFANGNYVEGYIYLKAAEGVSLNLPFLGFYGAWDQAPLFDTAYWYNNSFWTDGTTATEVEGSEYFHVVWTSLAGTSWVLGFNPYTGAVKDENGNVVYDPANNIISNNGDGLLDGIDDFYLSLMRNARTLTFTYTDENGDVVDTRRLDFVSKTMYKSSYGQVVPSIYSWYDVEMYDFTDKNGDPLPNGTKLTLTISGEIDYEGGRTHSLKEIPITLDTAYAEIDKIVESTVEGRNYLTLTVKDASLAYAQLMNPTGTQIWGEYTEFTKNEDGTYTLVLDVTDRGNEMIVALCDYGANEVFYDLTYSGENKPELDEKKLYAYRIYDTQTYDDSVYGWVSLDKQTTEVTRLTNDIYEYYALNAAEYAGGYVFAVDTGYNFIVMDPGLWTRKTICNLGINVVDMAFDETTGTMYLSAKTKDATGRTVCELYSIDLTTGELTFLKKYSNMYAMPWAMTFVDGELYAIKYYYAGLFKMNMENYELEAVKDANGADFKPKTSDGKTTTANYSQSMTYSEADGKIYWPFFKSSGGKVTTELFVIDPETLDYTTIAFPVATELVGVISVEDDGYELPVSDEISRILLADETVSLKEGDTTALSYSILPWNANIDADIVWSSSDETVATVDSEGKVTAIKEGHAIVTASCGEVTAECVVNVTHVEGELRFYDYYDANGSYEEWMTTDLATMESTVLAPSEIDFIAGDYNGHDNCFYGYTEGGAFYRVDMETMDVQQIGSGIMPWDMAYDYSTGLMYALIVSNYGGNPYIRSVNMRNGESETIGSIYGAYIVTLACATDGTLYGVGSEGEVYKIIPMEDAEGKYFETELVLGGFSVLQLIQSMCYDHNSGKLIWAKAEESELYWIDIDDPEQPFAVSLGDPTDSGAFQLVGIHTVPEQIPELPYVAVQSLNVPDLYMQIGKGKAPEAFIYPYNATNQNVTWSIADESIARIDENGLVVGVSQGETTLTATLVDGETTLTATATVTVMEYVGTIHGFVVNDLATGTGLKWAEIEDTNPGEPTYHDTYDATVYAAEYVDGKVYAYAETASGMEFRTLDSETYEVLERQTLDADVPYVCDMTYDYIRGTMYALAGNQSDTALYIVDMHTGDLMPYMDLDVTLMSLAATSDGTLYAIGSGNNAMLYTVDVDSRTCTEAFSTGIMSNSIASMAFDFDTGYLCWAAMYEDYDDYGELYSSSSLVMIDVSGRKVYDMGNIGAEGSTVSGMYIIAEEYPEKLDALQSVTISSNYQEMNVGENVQLQAVTQPAFLEADVTWSSADESVATVDQTGLVTAVAPGVTSVTVTAEYHGKSCTASCAIIVLADTDRFLSYNVSDHGWTTISRSDPTDDDVFLVEDNTAGDYTAVQSAAVVNGVIYGYDSENKFFKITDRDTYTREYLGESDVAFPEEQLRETDTGLFEIRDLAYDKANDRLLAIGTHSAITPAGDSIELRTYSKVYSVDLSNGHMTELTQVYRSVGQDATNIYAITVADDGTVYVYETFYHYVCSLDLETGLLTNLAPTYSFGAYGGSDCEDMSMEYDPITCTVYLLMYNQNSGYKYHQMFRYNPRTGILSNLGRVGERVYNKNTWRYEVDAFATLMIEGEHTHAWTAWTETTLHTCMTNGEETRACMLCGEQEARIVYATGHCYRGQVIDPTCTEQGYIHHECMYCGATFDSDYVAPLGHSYESEVVAPTCDEGGYTVYTCSVCGDSYIADETDPHCAASAYVDVDLKAWYHKAIDFVVDNGLMKGMSSTIFNPDGDMTRGQMVTVLHRLAGSPAQEELSPFTDVEPSSYYAEAIAWAYNNGIANGVDAELFDPDASVTREQMVTFMARYAAFCGMSVESEADLSAYTDAASVSHWASDAMRWAVEQGLITGMTNTTLAPAATATRAQVATVLMRFVSVLS